MLRVKLTLSPKWDYKFGLGVAGTSAAHVHAGDKALQNLLEDDDYVIIEKSPSSSTR